MAKITTPNVPPELQTLYDQTLMPDWTGTQQRVRVIPQSGARSKKQQRNVASYFKQFGALWRANPSAQPTYGFLPDPAGPARYFSRFFLQLYHRIGTSLENNPIANNTAYIVGIFTRLTPDSAAKHCVNFPMQYYRVERYKRSRWLLKQTYTDISTGKNLRIRLKVRPASASAVDPDTVNMHVECFREYIDGSGDFTESASFDVPYAPALGISFQCDETVFTSPASGVTANLTVKISFTGIVYDWEYAQALFTYEVDGVPLQLDNTPRVGDLGVTYSGRFSDCACRWYTEDVPTGELFFSDNPDYFIR